ncbi:MAG: hypothetical protein ACK5MV_01285 [Aminipila sp.]
MKKLSALSLIVLIIILSCSGCGDKNNVSEVDDKNTVKITEKLYLSYINDIYTNPEDYLGKTIELEGMFGFELWEDKAYNYVYRIGPGCCGNDGAMCGFEFTTDNDLPNSNDWIKVSGTLEQYEEDGYKILTLSNSSITVLEKRGKENIEI